MKAIALGILGSIVCLNLLVAAVKASNHPAPADPQAHIATLEARIADLEANAQCVGHWNMNIEEARDNDAREEALRPLVRQVLSGRGIR